MAEVVWTEPALEDLREILEYIANDSTTTAERTANLILKSVERLELFPQSGRMVPEFAEPTIREVMCGSFRLIYRTRGDRCSMVAIVRGSRDLYAAVRHRVLP